MVDALKVMQIFEMLFNVEPRWAKLVNQVGDGSDMSAFPIHS